MPSLFPSGSSRGHAAGQLDRFQCELYFMTTEMLDRLLEVVHFQRNVWTVSRRFQKRFLPDRERVWTDFILDPEAVWDIERHRRCEPQYSLIEQF